MLFDYSKFSFINGHIPKTDSLELVRAIQSLVILISLALGRSSRGFSAGPNYFPSKRERERERFDCTDSDISPILGRGSRSRREKRRGEGFQAFGYFQNSLFWKFLFLSKCDVK